MAADFALLVAESAVPAADAGASVPAAMAAGRSSYGYQQISAATTESADDSGFISNNSSAAIAFYE